MSYLDLLNIKYKVKLILIFIIVSIISTVIYVLNLELYDTKETYGYIENGLLITRLDVNFPDTINTMKYVVIGSKKYKTTLDKVGTLSVDKDTLTNYQEISLKINSTLRENQVFKIIILYNKEKVIKKVKKLLF